MIYTPGHVLPRANAYIAKVRAVRVNYESVKVNSTLSAGFWSVRNRDAVLFFNLLQFLQYDLSSLIGFMVPGPCAHFVRCTVPEWPKFFFADAFSDHNPVLKTCKAKPLRGSSFS